MKNADETETTSYQCMMCGQGFADETKLSKHMLEENGLSGEVPVVPAPKVRRFEIPAPLNVLPITPTTQSTFQCFITGCPSGYYKEGEWKLHVETAHSHKYESCD